MKTRRLAHIACTLLVATGVLHLRGAAGATTAPAATEAAADAAPAAALPSTLTPAEAQAVLRRAHWPKRAPGFYHRVDQQESRGRTTITESWEWLREDGQRLARTEVRRQRAKGKPLELSRVSLSTPEGSWTLHERVAIRQSYSAVPTDALAKLTAIRDQLAGLSAEERAEELAKYGRMSGVRSQRDGRTIVTVTFEYGEKIRAMMHDLADDALDDAKKRVPLLMRPVVSAVLVAKGGIDAQLPVKRVTEIDEATQTILSERQLKADGKEVGRGNRAAAWERCEPLPLDRFAVPAGLERIEAKSLAEYAELDAKHSKQDRERRAAAAKTEP